ncbi:hypothetical protein V5O48_017116 [Marasmius crinis-equi]|uniref:Thiaminase-2/PQQC domain-containing protein n=1 Tax=Marasmius crinis-equi TaxID=585013 RepID=A0ABR3EPW6_9AGAR
MTFDLDFLLFDSAKDPHARLVASAIHDEIITFSAYDRKGAGKLLKVVQDEAKPAEDIEIKKFWDDEDNQDVVKAFMTNKLCRDAARGDQKALDAFKRYAVQDYFYLVDWVRFRALRLATMPCDAYDLNQLNEELKSVGKSTNYARDWFVTCVEKLGVSEDDFQVERTVAEVAYSQYLQNNAHGDTWYNLHIILIGCYWAWCKLALELFNDPCTVKDTVFYNTWILPNVDTTDPKKPDFPKSAKALSKFLDENARFMTSETTIKQAKNLFRTSLRLEVALFNSGYEDVVAKPADAPDPLTGQALVPCPQRGQFFINVMRTLTYDELKKTYVSDHDNVLGSWIRSDKTTRVYTLGVNFDDEERRRKFGVETEVLEVHIGGHLFQQQVEALEFPGTSGKDGYVVGLSIEDEGTAGWNGWWCIGKGLRLGTKDAKVQVKTEGSLGMHWKLRVWYIPSTVC